MTDRLVVVGAGLATTGLVTALRSGGFTGEITVLDAAADAGYDRPPLSKGYLADPTTPVDLVPGRWWDEQRVERRWGVPVVEVRRSADGFGVLDADGRRYPADRVVLATGGAPALPPVPGVEHARTLRSRTDADRLRDGLGPGRRLLVVGAGLIGSEVAATATALGTAVTLVDPVVPLTDLLGWDLAVWLHLLHRERGVTMVADRVRAIAPGADGRLVVDVEGAALSADTVLVATGLRPVLPERLDPAPERSPDGAVLVDEVGRSSVPGLLAIGDCAAPRSEGRSAGHWESARLDGEAAATGLLGGAPPERGPAWFWSDRHGHHLEVLGSMADAEQAVVRGVLGEPPSTVLGLRGTRLVAAAGVDDPAAVKAARRLVASGTEVDAAALSDPAVPLRSLLRR